MTTTCYCLWLFSPSQNQVFLHLRIKIRFYQVVKALDFGNVSKSVKTFPKNEPSWTKESLRGKEFKQVWPDLQLSPDLWNLALQGLTAHSREFSKDETLCGLRISPRGIGSCLSRFRCGHHWVRNFIIYLVSNCLFQHLLYCSNIFFF